MCREGPRCGHNLGTRALGLAGEAGRGGGRGWWCWGAGQVPLRRVRGERPGRRGVGGSLPRWSFLEIPVAISIQTPYCKRKPFGHFLSPGAGNPTRGGQAGSQTSEVRLLRKVPARPSWAAVPSGRFQEGGQRNPWAEPAAGQGALEASPAPLLQPDHVALPIWAWPRALGGRAQLPTGFTFWLLGSPVAQAPPALGATPGQERGGDLPHRRASLASPPTSQEAAKRARKAGNARPQGSAGTDGALGGPRLRQETTGRRSPTPDRGTPSSRRPETPRPEAPALRAM